MYSNTIDNMVMLTHVYVYINRSICNICNNYILLFLVYNYNWGSIIDISLLCISNSFLFSIRIIECPNDNESILGCLRDNIEDLEGPFGVILFLYSVILTKVGIVCGWVWVGVDMMSVCWYDVCLFGLGDCYDNGRERGERATIDWSYTWTWKV